MPRTKAPRKARRRTRGEGTVYSQTRTWTTKDGKTRSKTLWVAALSEGREADGSGGTRRARRFFYADTAAAARAARDAYLRKKGEPVPVAIEMDPTTVEQFVDVFLDEWRRRPTLRGKPHSPATIDSYRITLAQHVTPHIGSRRLADLRSYDITALYKQLEAKVSSSMRARVHTALRVLLGFAVEEKILAVSPLVGIAKGKIPRHRRPKVQSLEPIQVARLLKAAKEDRLGAMIRLALDSGARQAELFGLEWRDIEFAKRRVRIRRSVSETSAGLSVGDLKTDTSMRNVDVSAETIAALKRRKAFAAREDLGDCAIVFPSERGYYLRKSNFLRETWNPIRKAAKIPDARFHSLRHTCATLLLSAGVHPKVVQERLGHASIQLTLDTYSDVLPTMQKQAADEIGAVLSRLDRQK
jgi:integrase